MALLRRVTLARWFRRGLARDAAAADSVISATHSAKPVQLAPGWLQDYLFGGSAARSSAADDAALDSALRQLDLPRLEGSAFPHLLAKADQMFAPYAELLERALELSANLPAPPDSWELAAGWTRYNKDGSRSAVPAPLEPLMFFDVEVCVQDGQLPTLAVALTDRGW